MSVRPHVCMCVFVSQSVTWSALFLKCREKSGSYFVFGGACLPRAQLTGSPRCCFPGRFYGSSLDVKSSDRAPVCLTTTESFCEAHTTNCRLSLSSFSLAVFEGLLNKGSPLSAQDNPVPGNPVPGGAWAKLAERFV